MAVNNKIKILKCKNSENITQRVNENTKTFSFVDRIRY